MEDFGFSPNNRWMTPLRFLSIFCFWGLVGLFFKFCVKPGYHSMQNFQFYQNQMINSQKRVFRLDFGSKTCFSNYRFLGINTIHNNRFPKMLSIDRGRWIENASTFQNAKIRFLSPIASKIHFLSQIPVHIVIGSTGHSRKTRVLLNRSKNMLSRVIRMRWLRKSSFQSSGTYRFCFAYYLSEVK